jgi:hypothetical protein
VRDEDLVGATSGRTGLFALSAMVSASSHVLSGFSNRCGKERAVFEEYPHHGDCRIPTYYDGRARGAPCLERGRGGNQESEHLLWERVQVCLPNSGGL